VAWETLYQGRS